MGGWLTEQESLGLTPNTLSAYGYALVDYLRFCTIHAINPPHAQWADIVAYIKDVNTRPKSDTHGRAGKHSGYRRSTTHKGFAKATVRLKLQAVKLYYEYLTLHKVRTDNPLKEGKYKTGKCFGGGHRGLGTRREKNPWIPTATQWQALLSAASSEPIRNRFMLALAYDAALRRGELCALQTADIDPSRRLVRLREETTKTQCSREVPYSQATATLYAAYLKHRRSLSREPGLLFLSESPRNRAQPLTIWTWSKTIQALGKRAGLPLLTTHTLRHLRLTDLAQAGWELSQIATFAGHSNPIMTMLYIHMGGRELSERYSQTVNSMLDWRQKTMQTSLL